MTTTHEVIRRSAVSVHLDTPLVEVAEILTADDIGLVVVRGHGGLAGVVSERDLVRGVAEGLDPTVDRAEDVMSPEILMCDPDVEPAEAGRLMLEAGVRHLVMRVEARASPTAPPAERVEVVSIRDVLEHVLTHGPDAS